jgi:serine acetyltransferase
MTIGSVNLIGAGSAVSRSFLEDIIAAGNPAKGLREV